MDDLAARLMNPMVLVLGVSLLLGHWAAMRFS
jgi:hypothetical protein